MIGRLTGVIAEKSPPLVLIDVQGVGYEVDVPMSTFYNLPGLGERVSLLTHFVVREDAQILFGFLSPEERATFRQLIKISGVSGDKSALMDELLKHYEHVIEGIRLVPSDGGRFEVTVNGKLLYSKLATHRHTEPGEILGLVRALVGE